MAAGEFTTAGLSVLSICPERALHARIQEFSSGGGGGGGGGGPGQSSLTKKSSDVFFVLFF